MSLIPPVKPNVFHPGDPCARAAGRKGRLTSYWNTTSAVDSPKTIRLNAEYQRMKREGRLPPDPRKARDKLIRDAAKRLSARDDA